MPKITINEVDASSAGVAGITPNAVYIPGLPGGTFDNETKKFTASANVEYNKPMYFTSKSEFQTKIGVRPFIFKTSVPYTTFKGSNLDGDNSFITQSDLMELYNNLLGITLTNGDYAFDALCTYLNVDLKKNNIVLKGGEKDTIISEDGLTATKRDEKITKSPNFIDANTPDKSYIMAIELLDQGIPVYYECVTSLIDENGENYNDLELVDNIYNSLFNNVFNKDTSVLLDRGEYLVRFISSGGYPSYFAPVGDLATNMCEFAQIRGDLVALIDYFDYFDNLGVDSVFKSINKWNQTSPITSDVLPSDKYTYGAMFAPYAMYTPTSISLSGLQSKSKTGVEQNSASKSIVLPASFGYLMSFAQSVKGYPIYYAVAGVARGSVPHYEDPTISITNIQADNYQPRGKKGETYGVALNPITTIKPYGSLIWGNRTLKDNRGNENLTATSFLNIRILSNEVKKHLYTAARRYTFEQNSDVLWVNFKSMIIPILDEMVANNGITGYKFIKQVAKEKATLKAKLILECVEAVEDFDLTIVLKDAVLNVNETDAVLNVNEGEE